MIWIVVGSAIALLLWLDRQWGPFALRSLRLKSGCDKQMAEPGETVTWTATVENTGRLSVPFVRLVQHFPAAAQVLGDPRWIRRHCKKGIHKWYVEEKISVRRRRGATRSLRLRFDTRGEYALGTWQLSAGDLLGFSEEPKTGDGKSLVIIPERAKSKQNLDALGGFLGDVSVRRFILEDPILTVGFRDYTGREPMRSISWTRTASAGSLQVKQFDHTAEQTVMILLDVEGGSAEQLEGCFRLMRSVCEELEKRKIPFGLRTNGDLPGPVGKIFSLADGLGSRHKNTILYALGRAQYTCYHSLRYLVRQTLKHRKNNECYIVITPEVTEQVRGMLKLLESAVGSGLCVLAGSGEVEA
jgi:hypothetical protein